VARSLAAAEAADLEAREAWDRVVIARIRGDVQEGSLRVAAQAALVRARRAIGNVADPQDSEDRRALATMRARLATLDERVDASGWVDRFAVTAASLEAIGERLSRLEILTRLAREPDEDRRRALFLALAPLWTLVDGDGGPGSPYRDRVRSSAWRPDPMTESWATAILEAWRDASPRDEVEPWDWWWQAGIAERRLAPATPLERLLPIAVGYIRALGADPEALGIRFDIVPRPDRPPVPVATTEFGARPRRSRDGTWTLAEPWVFASYTDGGLGNLTELLHEIGHAIHVAAIRTRPAFVDWPDSDPFTEAIAEIVALDTAEPAWQRRWLAPDAPAVHERDAIRGRYADVALDAAWALFESRMHSDPTRRPNDVWADITARWLHVAPHPEWSWWAIRTQLVQDPGYMANYAVGAVLAADLRAELRRDGDWLDGDPAWYPRLSDRLLRFGLERTSDEVVRSVLGRPPDARALAAQIARMR
jgi:hypothetical protein